VHNDTCMIGTYGSKRQTAHGHDWASCSAVVIRSCCYTPYCTKSGGASHNRRTHDTSSLRTLLWTKRGRTRYGRACMLGQHAVIRSHPRRPQPVASPLVCNCTLFYWARVKTTNCSQTFCAVMLRLAVTASHLAVRAICIRRRCFPSAPRWSPACRSQRQRRGMCARPVYAS
jgi:hypothetical protein